VTQVRDARRDDAAAIAAVHVASWKAAYRGILPDEYLDQLTTADRLPWWSTRLEGAPARGELTLVIEDDTGAVCGFATTGDDNGTVALLGAIYLLPEAWGRTLGQELHRGVLERLAAQGYEQVRLWVHPDNVRARRFYEAAGYVDENVEQWETVWGVDVPERRYRLAFG
jgi:RimJ/RimL family protein N-acetyltransferase